MAIEELKNVKCKVDALYEFTYKNGNKVTKRGSYLLNKGGRGFELDTEKIEALESIKLID